MTDEKKLQKFEFKKFIDLFTKEQQEKLNSYISQNLFTKEELLKIAERTFQIKKENSGNQRLAQKMFFAIALMSNSVSNFNLTRKEFGFEELKIRLLKGGQQGMEAANEMYSHAFLNKSFRGYHLNLPLFSEGNDGSIIFSTKEIPVEIKSRFPKILSYLSKFHSYMANEVEKFKFAKDMLVDFNFEIQDFLKPFDDETLFQEKHDFLHLENQMKEKGVLLEPSKGTIKRKTERLEVCINLRSAKIEPRDTFFMPKEIVDNNIGYTSFCSAFNGKFIGGVHCRLTLSEKAGNFVAKNVIEKCFKSKNIPKDEGVIVIYCGLITNEHALKFLKQVAEKYIQTHPGLFIIGLTENSTEAKSQHIATVLAIGEDIKTYFKDHPIVKKYENT